MAFRMQDLMVDVSPNQGYQLANERCTCAISAMEGGVPLPPGTGGDLDEHPQDPPDGGQGYNLANPECTCQITVGQPMPPDTGDLDGHGENLPSEIRALTAGLVALKAQLREMAGREAF